MPEGQFDILLEEKQAAEAPACQFFFSFLWSFTLSEHKNEASEKRELWDCHSLLW